MVTVHVLAPDEWERLRAARLAALSDAPERFSESVAEASARDESSWRSTLERSRWVTAQDEAEIVGIASVWSADPDDEVDAWIGGWWTAPAWRGRGVARALLGGIDTVFRDAGWRRQGLGVWCENAQGRAVFARLGFVETGGEQMSQRFPGRCYVLMERTLPPG